MKSSLSINSKILINLVQHRTNLDFIEISYSCVNALKFNQDASTTCYFNVLKKQDFILIESRRINYILFQCVTPSLSAMFVKNSNHESEFEDNPIIA